MSDFILEAQAATLYDIQRRHANELLANGIAQRALARGTDMEWYGSAATNTAAESLPVVMLDDSNPNRHNLLVYLSASRDSVPVVGTEVNIGYIEQPGTQHEVIVPEIGISMDDAVVVRALADELLARRSIDLPNLSSDLLAIYEPKERP